MKKKRKIFIKYNAQRYMFVCAICKKEFLFKIDIIRHISKKHEKEILEDMLIGLKMMTKQIKRINGKNRTK